MDSVLATGQGEIQAVKESVVATGSCREHLDRGQKQADGRCLRRRDKGDGNTETRGHMEEELLLLMEEASLGEGEGERGRSTGKVELLAVGGCGRGSS